MSDFGLSLFKEKILQIKDAFRKQKGIERDHFLEVLIETSFKTSFEVWYSDENNITQKIKVEGDIFSKTIFITNEMESISFRIFVQNPKRNENEKLYLTISQDDKILESKNYYISNALPYDGWFLFEKKI